MLGRVRIVPLLFLGLGLVGCGFAESPLPEATAGPDIYLEPDTRAVEDQVPRNATLASLLASHDMAGDVAYAVVEAMRPVFDPRRLRAGHPYKLVYGPAGRFRRFEYHVDEDQFLQVAGRPESPVFEAVLIDYEKVREQVAMRGEINRDHNSLFAAMDAGGGHSEVAMAIAQMFSGEIDFNTELRLGDSFAVLYEQFVRDDVHVTHGDVLAAAFNNDGRQLFGFRYEVRGEAPEYYDADGRSLKRQFLRSPLPFEPRITSRFSYRRLHPVLGTHRAHLGVDYGAPAGTRVIAVANGTLVSAAPSGGSGNMVRLRHTNGYETYYLHLSRFAKGLRRGARVMQGQTIGFVGSTGLATGPHLDYRVRKNGTFVNWLIEFRDLPPGDPVPPDQMAAFQEVRDRALALLPGWQSQRDAPVAANTQ
uniref:Putative peptidase family M23/M37 n=1 Tax=uncultured marine microorganism HF4000_APKG10H12 TaxID=455560 RepID=B3TC89_9ZZZZ|nr:putative peptidase family M23/M37 [uncultured marine microorganism HF4000_APKG10H12]